MNKRTLIVGTLLFTVVCLLTGAAMGECQKVRINAKSNYRVAGGCEGYENCAYGDFVGSINGLIKSGWDDSDVTVVGGALVISTDSIVETNHGEIWGETRLIRHLGTVGMGGGYGHSIYIYGGTGKYEGVTGWMDGGDVPAAGTLAKYEGEICWPEGD